MGNRVWPVEDEASFLVCYRESVADVFRYAAMLCGTDRGAAEDLVQEVYLLALRRVQTHALETVTTSYLKQAVRHRFLDIAKSRQRETRRLQLVWNSSSSSIGNDERPDRLADLPERQRAAMVLRYIDDLPVAEVGRALGISGRAAESLLARATRRLREGAVRHG
jgi:RNA polymerase sigma-70 factor, ECF subfamily